MTWISYDFWSALRPSHQMCWLCWLFYNDEMILHLLNYICYTINNQTGMHHIKTKNTLLSQSETDPVMNRKAVIPPPPFFLLHLYWSQGRRCICEVSGDRCLRPEASHLIRILQPFYSFTFLYSHILREDRVRNSTETPIKGTSTDKSTADDAPRR